MKFKYTSVNKGKLLWIYIHMFKKVYIYKNNKPFTNETINYNKLHKKQLGT